MNRCMLLAAFLFDAFRTPPGPATVREVEGNVVIDEAYHVTPGQFARLSQREQMRGGRA